jgi:Xaa-Pro aminopeptidase
VTLQDEFRARRNRVLEAIHPGALLIFSAPVAIRNNDVEHEYRQDSDFYYLTGFDEPDSALFLRSDGDARTVLFVRPRDPERETWDGPRAGVDGARVEFGADQSFPFAEFDAKLPELLRGTPRLFYGLGHEAEADGRVLRAIASLRRRTRQPLVYPTSISEPDGVLHEMRLLKSPLEIDLMRRAVDITDAGHRELMRITRPGMYEFELEGVLRRTFRAAGSERHAYSPIVGSGPNATILHHRKNDRRIEEGDLVLVDAGCEYGYYAADVTRTYPANGKFSAAQASIYSLVLRSQEAAIEKSVAGSTLEAVHEAAVEVITQGLIELGLIEGPFDVAISEQRYKKYFMHRTSHWLGMDVHDVGRYYSAEGPRPLAPGMVLTVEPGVYIAQDAAVPEEFRGIGVRIEDDVLVDAARPVVLSGQIPKTIAEVEAACAR